MRQMFRSLTVAALLVLAVSASGFAQAPVAVQLSTPATGVVPIPISATAIVNTQTTLTIPAPAGGLSNYVCSLAYEVSNDGTGTAASNVVSTSTNFNAFAVKFSQPATVNLDSGVLMAFQASPGGGCAKSTIPGTATTFVSPAGLTHATWTWYSVYYQAP